MSSDVKIGAKRNMNEERKVNRRDFLKGAAVAAAGMVATGCGDKRIVIQVVDAAKKDAGIQPTETPKAQTGPTIIKVDSPKLAVAPKIEVAPKLEVKPIVEVAMGEGGADRLKNIDWGESGMTPEGILPNYFTNAVRYWWDSGWIERWSKEWNIPKIVVATIMQIESCGHPALTSTAGAIGLFQVMPFHFAADENPWEVETNAKRGLAYYRTGLDIALKKGYKDLEALVESAKGYNGGHGVIGVATAVAETNLYEKFFRGFLTGNREVINYFNGIALRPGGMGARANEWAREQGSVRLEGGVEYNLSGRNPNIVRNIGRIVEISKGGIVIDSGRMINYNDVFGPYNARNGYVLGIKYYGDGACDVESVIYKAIKLGGISGLQVERTAQHGENIPGIEREYQVSIFADENGKSVHDMTVINRSQGRIKIILSIENNVLRVKAEADVGLNKTERAKSGLDGLVGIAYKTAGYKDDTGKWCTWYGGEPSIDGRAGLCCGGHLLEAARIFRIIKLKEIDRRRNPDRVDPSWLWYGYDEVMNLTDLLQGKVFKVSGLDWKENEGFVVADWVKLAGQMKVGRIYLASINRTEATVGREHHHVLAILPTTEGVWVYESNSKNGSVRIGLKELRDKYVFNPDYRMWVTEVELPG